MTVGCVTTASAAQCVFVKFVDGKGVAVSSPVPVIGMMVGDRLVHDGDVPVGTEAVGGAEASCPDGLVQGVRETFEASCVSEQRRNQAAAEHKVDRKVIDKSCGDLIKALGTSLVAPVPPK